VPTPSPRAGSARLGQFGSHAVNLRPKLGLATRLLGLDPPKLLGVRDLELLSPRALRCPPEEREDPRGKDDENERDCDSPVLEEVRAREGEAGADGRREEEDRGRDADRAAVEKGPHAWSLLRVRSEVNG
jgi:hypothetical protein